jgi:hypothetical protein
VKWISQNNEGREQSECIWFKKRQMAVFFARANKTAVYIKFGQHRDGAGKCWLLKK